MDFICNYCECRSLASASQSWKCHRFFNTFVSLNIHSSAIPYRWRKCRRGEGGVCGTGLSVPWRLWCFPNFPTPCPGHGEVVLGQKLAVPTAWAGCPGTHSHHCHEKTHHQPEFFSSYHRIGLERTLKIICFQHTISGWQGFLSGKLTARTAFACRAQDGDAQQTQDPWHIWAVPGWLFPNSIRETFRKSFRAAFFAP